MQRGQVVLVDTNVIIEAFRAHSWSAVTTHFTVETIETCYEEALTGDPLRPDCIALDAAQLRNGLRKRHAIEREQRAQLRVRLAYEEGLDAGESDLFAHALGRVDAWIASCADRAAVYAALELGWEDRFVSLEAMAHAAGAKPTLRHHFTDRWLKEVRISARSGADVTRFSVVESVRHLVGQYRSFIKSFYPLADYLTARAVRAPCKRILALHAGLSYFAYRSRCLALQSV